MPRTLRSGLVAVLCSCLLALPVMGQAPADSGQATEAGQTQLPLGVVTQVRAARLAGAAATVGSNVYGGDSLSTDSGGTLRLKVGFDGQLYLLGGSEAQLVQNGRAVQANASRGTVGFASTAENPIQLNTPLGLVHPVAGEAAYGQVQILGPTEMIVTAYKGDLQIDRPCETQTVHQGNAYQVTLAPGAPEKNKCGAAATGNSGVIPALNTHLVVKLVAIGVGTGVLVWLLWPHHHHRPVSPSGMSD
ncbi:MAG: hypothetical protein ACRD4S_17110 [Candidatus Acidiferrales bacterium]